MEVDNIEIEGQGEHNDIFTDTFADLDNPPGFDEEFFRCFIPEESIAQAFPPPGFAELDESTSMGRNVEMPQNLMPDTVMQPPAKPVDYELFLHPLFGRLLEVHLKVLAVSRPPEEIAMVRYQFKAAVEKIVELSREYYSSSTQLGRLESSSPEFLELTMFISKYVNLYQGFLTRAEGLIEEGMNCNRSIEARIGDFVDQSHTSSDSNNIGSQMPGNGKGKARDESAFAGAGWDEQALFNELRDNHPEEVMELAREFREKKKNTGKLPEPATKMLLQWFEAHKDLPMGPYPSEEEKSTMCNATGLTLTQINNWFINQRKRHWQKR